MHVEENSNENKEEEVEEEDEEEEPEEEKEEESSSFEEEGEADDDDKRDPWSSLPQKVGEDLKEPYMEEVQRSLDRGKAQDYAENAAFNTLLPVSRRRLERLKWTHHIKYDAIHCKVMKTLRHFIEEDNKDFAEASESVVAKRKFPINRIKQNKPLPDESHDNKEEEV